MRVLAVDVGTGTQDIILYDTEQPIENACKLVMPSPTMTAAAAIRRATVARQAVLFRGVMMGGGPCAWATTEHIGAGLAFFATPTAARTFDDDLEVVERMGVQLVDDDAASGEADLLVVEARDFQYDLIVAALEMFGVDGEPDAACVAVFDHGNAPPGVSDRVFRFEYLRDHVRTTANLRALVHASDAIPERFTRFQAVVDSYSGSSPLFVMDTASAAIVGALEDPNTTAQEQVLVANIGNFHCLAFHLDGDGVVGLFEHHTGELTAAELERYLRQLGNGTISNDEVYADSGHGAIVYRQPSRPATSFAVTGPRRGLLRGSALQPYFAVPHGDMMLAGCFGLLRAAAPHLGISFVAQSGG